MQSQRNKVKMPLLLYSLFLVIAILATFNYFLSTGLPTQQILTENFENDRNLKNQEESVVSEEEQSKRIKTCLYFWGERHQDSPSDINKDANGCPREIPEMLYDQFTMGRTIGVEYWYQCQTGPQYDAKHVYTKESIDNLIERIRRREENYYGHTDTFLYRYHLHELLSLSKTLNCELHFVLIHCSCWVLIKCFGRLSYPEQICCYHGKSAADL